MRKPNVDVCFVPAVQEGANSIVEAGQPCLRPLCMINGLEWVVPVDIREE